MGQDGILPSLKFAGYYPAPLQETNSQAIMANARILIIDDEPSIVNLVTAYLKPEGYELYTATDGESGLKAARAFKPDLVVLDVMLPGMDGFEVTRVLRREQNTPILMLTARDDEIDRVVGLEVGADDYLTKPFSMRELMARVKAQLRRARLIREELGKQKADTPQEKISFGNLVVNQTRREVILNEAPLQLKPKEYELLQFLAEHRGQMLSREFILERVWGWDYIGDSRTVDVHVRWLRQKIESDPGKPERIITVRGGGYRFEG